MQRPNASVPKPNRIGSTHNLAELGAISSPTTQSSGSSVIFTRPIASVPKPIVPGTINAPISNGAHIIASVPKPTGVASTFTNRPIATPLGHTGRAQNQVLGFEE